MKIDYGMVPEFLEVRVVNCLLNGLRIKIKNPGF